VADTPYLFKRPSSTDPQHSAILSKTLRFRRIQIFTASTLSFGLLIELIKLIIYLVWRVKALMRTTLMLFLTKLDLINIKAIKKAQLLLLKVKI